MYPMGGQYEALAQDRTLGLSLLSKIIKSGIPGPNEFKLKSTPKEIKQVIAAAGPALAAIPGWGTLAAAGAAVITAADQKRNAERVIGAANSGSFAQLLQEYQGMMGTVPGRVFGVDVLERIADAAGQQGLWPNVKKWSGDAIHGAIFGCKGCTPPTMKEWAAKNASGDPTKLVNDWSNHVQSTWGSKWLVQAGPVQRQIIIDLLDALISEANPNAPLYYGIPAAEPTPAAPPTPASASPAAASKIPPGASAIGTTPDGTPVYRGTDGLPYVVRGGVPYLWQGAIDNQPGTTAPLPVPTPAPMIQPAQPPPVLYVPTPTGETVDISSIIGSVLQQGQNQQQAFLTAMQALQAKGVQPTPQLQAAVAKEVQSSAVGGDKWLIGGAAVAGLVGLAWLLRRRRRG
jgi:hypothetical protein